jgi:hypothetical protein
MFLVVPFMQDLNFLDAIRELTTCWHVVYGSGSQPLPDRGPVNSFFYKTRARYNWCQGRGPAIEKHWCMVHTAAGTHSDFAYHRTHFVDRCAFTTWWGLYRRFLCLMNMCSIWGMFQLLLSLHSMLHFFIFKWISLYNLTWYKQE